MAYFDSVLLLSMLLGRFQLSDAVDLKGKRYYEKLIVNWKIQEG